MKCPDNLTKNRVPWCLLTEDEQNAFVVATHPPKDVTLQVHTPQGWVGILSIVVASSHQVYRIKPKPPKPREFWINTSFKHLDARHTKPNNMEGYIHVREVIE
tara:strand:+ start:756 stop:1064 length:309 start_codon:yes stop_codon:yes gene_type:complete